MCKKDLLTCILSKVFFARKKNRLSGFHSSRTPIQQSPCAKPYIEIFFFNAINDEAVGG